MGLIPEITVSAPCEHGTFTVQVSTPGVWYLPGAGRLESDGETVWVFHQEREPCECWVEEDDG